MTDPKHIRMGQELQHLEEKYTINAAIAARRPRRMQPHERIIFALDVNDPMRAVHLAEDLSVHVGMFKVGLELFVAGGPILVARLRERGLEVMLDLKLHDIPETVERAVRVSVDIGPMAPRFLTMHVQQRETLERAVAATAGTRTQLLGVTVLTSMEEGDLRELQQPSSNLWGETVSDFTPAVRVRDMAALAIHRGVPGLVCSPKEVASLRSAFRSALLVVPGIRPTGASQDDQKRVGTPRQAILDGADYLVVGRPIRDAKDPVQAAQTIAYEVAQAERELAGAEETKGRLGTEG